MCNKKMNGKKKLQSFMIFRPDSDDDEDDDDDEEEENKASSVRKAKRTAVRRTSASSAAAVGTTATAASGKANRKGTNSANKSGTGKKHKADAKTSWSSPAPAAIGENNDNTEGDGGVEGGGQLEGTPAGDKPKRKYTRRTKEEATSTPKTATTRRRGRKFKGWRCPRCGSNFKVQPGAQ